MILRLKKKWFDKIKSGEKTHEYRIVKDYWIKRFSKVFTEPDKTATFMKDVSYYVFHPINCVLTLTCGYPKREEKDKFIEAEVKTITIRNGKGTDLEYDGKVFDIEFEIKW